MSRAPARAGRAAVAAVLLLAGGPRGAAADPALDYMLNCQGCHRADGGATPDTIPPLTGSVARFLAVPGGREYLVQVPGVSQAQLDDATLAALLNWIVRHFDAEHVPPRFAPYEAAEVARLRRDPLTDVESVRARLVRAMDAPDRSPP